MAAVALDAEEAEVTPMARVHRSRLAVAVAVTLAGLPLLVLDNLSANAQEDDRPVEAAVADTSSSSESSAPSSTAAPTTTSTTEAPSTTVAPVPTTEPAPPTTAAPVQALSAPAPTAPPTTSAPAPPPTVAPRRAGDPNDPQTWERLAQCESGGTWAMNSGNGYYGGLQFSLATWGNVGGSGYPHQATKAEQIKRGQILQQQAGWGQWPHCSRELGYR